MDQDIYIFHLCLPYSDGLQGHQESPNDVQALAGLATAFPQTGRTDSALAT